MGGIKGLHVGPSQWAIQQQWFYIIIGFLYAAKPISIMKDNMWQVLSVALGGQ